MPAPVPTDGQLPPLEEWREKFWHTKIKPTLHNLQTARTLVQGFGIATAKSPKVVLEAFAGKTGHCNKVNTTETKTGPGTLSRALCELPPSVMSKLIILEHNPLYLPYLEASSSF